jgi:hypothetical protein
MFGDMGWDWSHAEAQNRRMAAWLKGLDTTRLAIIECGAGKAVPTVRRTSEDVAHRYGGTMIRVNPRETGVPPGHLAITTGALAALRAIDDRLKAKNS